MMNLRRDLLYHKVKFSLENDLDRYQGAQAKRKGSSREVFNGVTKAFRAFLLIGAFLFVKNKCISYTNERKVCFKIRDMWNASFPGFTIESALRVVDINGDKISDVIVAFGTGVDAAYYSPLLCQIYFNFTAEDAENGCGGGVMALDGSTGHTLWTTYTKHEIFAVNCAEDIDEDGINDCIVGGRMASLLAVSGADGSPLWSLSPSHEALSETSNFYTPLHLSLDADNDGFLDVLLMHGGDPLRRPSQKVRLPARLIIVSARTGDIITWSQVPGNTESYYSPQEITDGEGRPSILFGTGGETHPGSLYVLSFKDLLQRRMENAKAIYTDCCKGIMVPPVLIDINQDKKPDIVMSLFNSTVMAFDGLTFKVIWKTSFPNSETYSTPAVGFFNEDDIPDFFITYQHGPGFPIYYYSQANVLDGKNGKPLLSEPEFMLVGTQSSPLTVSTSGTDSFLFWVSSCENVTRKINESILLFKIVPGTSVHDASRADYCRLRYGSRLYTELVLLNKNTRTVVYNSLQAEDQERVRINFQAILDSWTRKHNITALRRRRTRHVGLHDGDGVQRVISTGALAPSKYQGSIDILFATYWFPSSNAVRLLTPKMQSCIDQLMEPEIEAALRLTNSSSIFYGQDHDAYEELVSEACSLMVGEKPLSSTKDEGLFGKKMGSMTVYRKSIIGCKSMKVTDYEKQMWSGYMGHFANSVANVEF